MFRLCAVSLTDGPFRLRHYPRAKAALRKALAHRRFAQ
jgi:hypothetical protein